nr:radical SAM protein [uncultured Faecalimonas sp.]
MIILNSAIRVTQNLDETHFMDQYIVYNSKTGKEVHINFSCYLLLEKINNGKVTCKSEVLTLAKQVCKNGNEVIELLFENQIIEYSKEYRKNQNLLATKKVHFPLTYLALEITRKCNLNCEHCYGQYGKENVCPELTLEYIKGLKPILDRLHTKSIALTGGEVLTHKNFEEIALFFLENGFKLTIFTNGYAYKRLEKFLERAKEYHMYIAISLDGLEETHNTIRRCQNAYENTLKSLYLLKKYPNIDTAISTAVMPKNIDEIEKLKELEEEKFPEFRKQYDLVFPTNDAKQSLSAFKVNELKSVYEKCPFIFEIPEKEVKRKFRCSGGVTSAALDALYNLKICMPAEDKEFLIGNLIEEDLYKIWVYPNNNIKHFRKEKVKGAIECKKCTYKKKCNLLNCRLIAYYYTGNSKRANPVVCFTKEVKEMR